jgi:hypothetical protein
VQTEWGIKEREGGRKGRREGEKERGREGETEKWKEGEREGEERKGGARREEPREGPTTPTQVLFTHTYTHAPTQDRRQVLTLSLASLSLSRALSHTHSE